MVIISSFYNEEYLLPWWLEHHKSIFSHGVLFDYYSTDNSIDIIKDICPTWEIRPTKNKDWSFADNDSEFMEAEREFQGYKAVLTTTEFLVGDLPTLHNEHTFYSIPIVRLVDTDPLTKPVYGRSLIEQKNVGFLDTSNKRRFLHNYSDGRYGIGRHSTDYQHKDIPMLIFKYMYSPWNDVFINRKLSMKDRVNSSEIKRGWGKHHSWDRERLEGEYEKSLNYKLKEFLL